ncbi:MAG: polymer-forming cytoskeletal protein [Chloroflexota bacterium]
MSVRGSSGDYSSGDGYAAAEPFSLIDRNSGFDGAFTSDRDLRIEGSAKGSIDCKGTVFIAEDARVDATVDAEHVTVAGSLSGEIRCRGRLQVLPTGRLRGKVSTQSLIINEGAIYEGQLEMPSAESARSARPVSLAGDRPGSGSAYIRRMGGAETAWEPRAVDSADAAGEPAAAEPD